MAMIPDSLPTDAGMQAMSGGAILPSFLNSPVAAVYRNGAISDGGLRVAYPLLIGLIRGVIVGGGGPR